MKRSEEQTTTTTSTSSSHARLDPLAMATLAVVVVMLAMSLWNLRDLSRLSQRVAALENALARPAAVESPDPNQVHTVNVAGAAAKGPEAAPVTIVEFSDFQCPFCARVRLTLEEIEDTYGQSVRIVWKHLPLPIHPEAVGAALAAEAAANQGKFWQYHDLLFANQEKINPEGLTQFARDLQLDMSRFEMDLQNPEAKKKIETDVAESEALGITATPGIFVNGRFILGAQPYEVFAKIIDEELTKRNLPVPARASPES